jgi:hypothetical protein
MAYSQELAYTSTLCDFMEWGGIASLSARPIISNPDNYKPVHYDSETCFETSVVPFHFKRCEFTYEEPYNSLIVENIGSVLTSYGNGCNQTTHDWFPIGITPETFLFGRGPSFDYEKNIEGLILAISDLQAITTNLTIKMQGLNDSISSLELFIEDFPKVVFIALMVVLVFVIFRDCLK